MKWEVHVKHLSCILQYYGCLKEVHSCDWVVSWISCFFHETPFLFEKMTQRLSKFGYVAGICWNEWSKHVTSKKTDSVGCQWENWAFRKKLQFWKTYLSLWVWQLPSTYRFLMRLMGITWCYFFILCNEICQHWKDLHNLVNQCFLYHQCIMLQGHLWAKDLFREQDRLMDFNVTDYWYGFRFHIVTYL